MKTPKIDYDQVADKYAQHRGVVPGVLQGLTSRLGPTSRVLEVGCGTGNYISAIEASVGCSCWGVDPSEQMLRQAAEQSRRVHFQVGRAEQMEFPDGSFDCVFSVDVIHHVQDRAAFFREAWRVLQEGGEVWTVTDSEDIIRRRHPLSTYFPETIDVDLARYPSIAELRRLMEQAGFQQMHGSRGSVYEAVCRHLGLSRKGLFVPASDSRGSSPTRDSTNGAGSQVGATPMHLTVLSGISLKTGKRVRVMTEKRPSNHHLA